MKHLISIVALLAMFFLVGPGSAQHVSARSVLVLASDDNSKVSKKKTQAKAQAKLHLDNFMRTYNKICSIYGFLHEEFDNTPGNIRYERVVKNWRRYETNRKRLLDITDKLSGPTDLDAQSKAEGFADRNWQLKLAASDLNSYIEPTRLRLARLKKDTAEIGERAQTANAAMKKTCEAKTKDQAKPFAEQSIKAASQAISSYKNNLDSQSSIF